MFKYLLLPLLIAVLIIPTTLVQNQVFAQEDVVEDEDTIVDDSKVESEEEEEREATEEILKEEKEEEEEKQQGVRTSADAETTVLFPDYPDKKLPAGKPIFLLVGFHNKGEKEYTVQTLDASFRYPQDYSYHIQNFTGTQYDKTIKPGQEGSFIYAFHPHESYGGRPFGLTVMMFYKDGSGIQYAAGVFNETVTFQEIEESFDGESFFLYVLLGAVALLAIFGLNYKFNKSKFKKSSSKPATETGTQGDKNNVDYDWLPKETTTFNKPSPRQSPRQRRLKRSSGSNEE
jgi:translocon-associated protein subunit alpha